MSTIDSITLWKNRIASRESSGLKVSEWCANNNISRHVYYYWHRKVTVQSFIGKEKFVEVPIKSALNSSAALQTEKSELMIKWKDISITVTDSNSVNLAAELLCRLEKSC